MVAKKKNNNNKNKENDVQEGGQPIPAVERCKLTRALLAPA